MFKLFGSKESILARHDKHQILREKKIVLQVKWEVRSWAIGGYEQVCGGWGHIQEKTCWLILVKCLEMSV